MVYYNYLNIPCLSFIRFPDLYVIYETPCHIPGTMNQPGNMMPSTSDSPGDRGPAPKRKKENSDTCEGPQLRMNPACVVHVNGLEHGQL